MAPGLAGTDPAGNEDPRGQETDRKFEGGAGPGEDTVPAITPDILSQDGGTANDLRRRRWMTADRAGL